MKNVLLFLALFLTTNAWATGSTLKQIDAIENSTGGSSLSIPGTGSTLATDTNTLTFTGKSMSGASNTFTLIPVGAIGNGSVLSGSNTGDVTSAAVGSSPNANGFTLTGQVLNLQPANASFPGALLAADWSTFNSKQPAGNYITALTGDVTASGPGSAAATLATVNSNVGSFTNANITVNAKGLITAASNGSSVSPALNGGSASPQSVTAAGGISLTGLMYMNEVWVIGSPGAVTVTATPSVTACTADGQQLKIHGTDNTKTVKLQDQSSLASSGLYLNGPVTLAAQQSIQLHCDMSLSAWVEDSRSN
jgi:hypothetical protein